MVDGRILRLEEYEMKSSEDDYHSCVQSPLQYIACMVIQYRYCCYMLLLSFIFVLTTVLLVIIVITLCVLQSRYISLTHVEAQVCLVGLVLVNFRELHLSKMIHVFCKMSIMVSWVTLYFFSWERLWLEGSQSNEHWTHLRYSSFGWWS